MKAYLALLLAAAAILSGCLGGGGSKDPEPSDSDAYVPPVVTDTEGAIAGAVADESITPIEGAVATLTGAKSGDAATDAMGRFQFDHLAPGRYAVTVMAYGYYPLEKAFDVKAGAVSDEAFLLEPLPSTDPYHDDPALRYAGFLECQTGFALTSKPATPTDAATDTAADAVDPVPLFGFDPLVDGLVRGTDREFNESSPYGLRANTCGIVAIATGLADQPSNDKFLFYGSSEEAGLQGILFEMKWSPRSASASKLSFTVEPCVPTSELVNYTGTAEMQCYSNAYEFTYGEGVSPIGSMITYEDLVRVTKEFNGNETEATEINEEGEPVTGTGNIPSKPQDFTQKVWYQIRIFTVTDELGPAPPADYGLVVQQPFELFATRFYYAAAPEEYSGIPDE